MADELLTASADARPADILRGHSGCASAATSGLFVFLSCRMRDGGKRRDHRPLLLPLLPDAGRRQAKEPQLIRASGTRIRTVVDSPWERFVFSLSALPKKARVGMAESGGWESEVRTVSAVSTVST